MTVAARASTISYDEDGSTTAFPLPFRYAAPSTIAALRRYADGSMANLAYGADYAVSDAPTDAGGTATVTAAAAAGTVIVFARMTPLAQDAQYPTNDRFPARLTENALDLATLIAQEQRDEIGRSIRMAPGETLPTLPAAAARAGTVLGFGLGGAPLLLPPSYDNAPRTAFGPWAPGDPLLSGAPLDIFSAERIDLGKFGIIDSATLDQTAAMRLVAAYVSQQPRGRAIHWGPRQVLITGDVVFNGNVSVFGEGPAVSQLLCASGGRLIANGTSGDDQTGNQVRMQDFRIQVVDLATVTPLRIINSTTDQETGLAASFTGVEFVAGDGGGYPYAVELVGLSNITFDDCRFQGGRTTPLYGDGGVYAHTPAGLDRADLKFSRCQFFFLKTPVNVDGHFEGVGLSRCMIVACYRAVRWYADSDQAEPQLNVEFCHLNCEYGAFDLKRIVQFTITFNLFYLNGVDGTATSAIAVRVELGNGPLALSAIVGNQFFMNGEVPATMIKVIGDPSVAAATNIVIDQNVGYSVGHATSVGVDFDANTKGIFFGLANNFRGFTTEIADAGNNTICYVDNAGRIGLQQSDPQYALHVGGAIKTDGYYVQGDGTAEFSGVGSPEGAITATPGSRYWRSGQPAGSRLYYKNAGSGNTGWVAVL